jgi:hypothetical protein
MPHLLINVKRIRENYLNKVSINTNRITIKV